MTKSRPPVGDTTADSPDWMTAQVVHSNAGLWWRDGYQWRGIGHTGTTSPLSALPVPFNVGVTTQPGPVTVVIDAVGNVACDLDSITSLDGDIRELLSNYLPGDTTQPTEQASSASIDLQEPIKPQDTLASAATQPQPTDEPVYSLFGDYLAVCVNQCTCYGGQFGHERGCGYEPIAKVAEIEAALGAVAEIRALHRPLESSMSAMYPTPQCLCGDDHPCETTQILDKAGAP